MGATFSVSVNVSARELMGDGLAGAITDIVRRTGLDARCLCVEISELAVIRDVEAAVRNLRAVRAIGARMAAEDFGTGYSSLAYLQRFPLDILNIDKSFVGTVDGGPSNAALSHAIVRLAETLDRGAITPA